MFDGLKDLEHIKIIRACDIFFSFCVLFILFPLILLILLFCFFDTGSPVFCQKRIGLNRKPFTIFKFRTMRKGTKSTSTHLVNHESITYLGRFLRRSKIDEIPQLVNVIKGEMSLVGPRPSLLSQIELNKVRENSGVFSVKPGITGLSQINKIDMSTPDKITEMDTKMIETMSLKNYFKYIILTVLGRGQGDQIKY